MNFLFKVISVCLQKDLADLQISIAFLEVTKVLAYSCIYSSDGNVKFIHTDVKSFKKHAPEVTRIHRSFKSSTVLLMLSSPEITQEVFPFF